MSIPKCKSCLEKFSWGKVSKSIWLGYTLIECSHCKTKHFVTMRTRIFTACSIVVPIIVANHFHTILKGYSLLLYILWICLLIFILPFMALYKTNTN